jgi:hypothetical protein
MAHSSDERPISLEEVVSAVATHELAALTERLVRERSWTSLVVMFGYVAGPRTAASLDSVRSAGEALRAALQVVPPPRRPGGTLADQIRTARLAAGDALLARVPHPPVTDLDRLALRTAASLLAEAGDHRRAAGAYEELADDAMAADSYGAMGDLDRMEAALAREEARLGAERAGLDAARAFEARLGAGERVAAIAAAARIPATMAAGAAIRQQARRIDERLIRGHAVTLRIGAGGPPAGFRLAAAPAAIGRDPLAEIPIRDPGVSRRHALIAFRDGELALEDTGSRAGVRVAGAQLGAPLPLRGEGELGLGRDCRVHFRAIGAGRVLLRGVTGLDRQLVVLVGIDPLPLGELFAGAGGTWLELGTGVPRLCRPDQTPVRVDGQYIGPFCQLLHGDVLEIGRPAADGAAASPLRIEVE